MLKSLFGAAAVIAGLAALPANAQGVPGGSYLRTCTNVYRAGDQLFAACRTVDGDWQQTALDDVSRCQGGIANTDGQLTCNYRRYRSRGDYGYSDRGYGNNYGWVQPAEPWAGYGSRGYNNGW